MRTISKLTVAQKTLEYYVILSGESTPPVPTPTQVTIDGNFEIQQSGSIYTMSFGIQNFDWSSLESGWTGTVVYGQTTLTFDSTNLNNNTITISVSESQIDLTAATATMEITSGTDEYEGTSNVEVIFVDYMYIENTYNGTNTVTINTVSSQTVPAQQFFTSTLEYSKDKLNWSTLNLSIGTQHTITLNQGEKVYFRNNNGVLNYYDRSTSTWVSNCFSADEYHSAGGNVNSLGDYTNMDNFTIPTGFLFNLFGIDVNTGDVTLNDISQLRMPATTLANFCYKNVFSNCIGITQIPATLLPATTLAEGCYMWLFQNTGISTVPSGLLPALTMQSFCYQGLFENCIYLTTVPSNMLTGTTLANYCYTAMFYGCTSLTSAPALPATTLSDYCYNNMFKSCTSLTTAPALPATTLASSCYRAMFDGCTSLTTTPELPASTVMQYSYAFMFQGCGITSATLPATHIDSYGCQRMFKDCSSLNKVTTYINTLSGSNAINNWLSGVSPTGTFYNLGTATYNRGVSGIPTGWTEVLPIDYMYIENLNNGTNTLTLTTTKAGNPSSGTYATSVEYSKDKTNWITITFNTTTPYSISMNSGEKVYFRNNSGNFNYYYTALNYWTTTFTTNSDCGVGGDLRTIVNYRNPTLTQGCFARLFYGCSSLTTAPTLPATTLANSCYQQMFYGCTSLTTAPTLPATTLANNCYQEMFRGCTSLTTAPALPATTLTNRCYYEMFQNCTSLTTAPELYATTLNSGCYEEMFSSCTSLTTAPTLPATTLANNCYKQMFSSCTSLTTAPTLPATTLAQSCYENMFSYCTSLTNAPALPATTLVNNCYNSMFGNCTSLTTAPTLSATTMATGCYESMFFGCTSLTTAPTLSATTMATSCYKQMLYGCTSLTNAPALPATTLAQSCYENMFGNCTSLTTAPTLSATTMATSCYESMFFGCTSLTTAPTLPATTLTDRCYYEMFRSCRSLNNVVTFANDISATNCISGWLSDVAATGTFYNNGTATYPSGTSGIPTGWTEMLPPDYMYVENTYAGNNTLTFTTTTAGSPLSSYYSTTVEYSKDKTNWTTIFFDTSTPQTITLNQGEKVYLRNNNGLFNYTDSGVSNYYVTTITCSESHDIGGNVTTILDYSDENVYIPMGCFYKLFINNNTLQAANITFNDNIGESCYREMFKGCTSLTTPPAILPATTLASSCYRAMFDSCTSLTTTPELPANRVEPYSYAFMFQGGGITSATFKATYIKNNGCQRMFKDCPINSLTVYIDTLSGSNAINNWLSGVSPTGTFYNLGTATYNRGVSGIPTGWTEEKVYWSNTTVTSIGTNQCQLESDLYINGITWDEGYFHITNEVDQDRSVYFYTTDVTNNHLVGSNIINQYDPTELVQPAVVTLYNGGTAVWTGNVYFTAIN